MLSIGQIILRIFVFIYMIKVPEIDRTRNVKYEFIKLFGKDETNSSEGSWHKAKVLRWSIEQHEPQPLRGMYETQPLYV